MKKLFGLLIACTAMLFTSCIEITEIVYRKNGGLNTDVRISVSNAIAAMSGKSSVEFFGEFDKADEEMKKYGITCKKIITESDTGIVLTCPPGSKIPDEDEGKVYNISPVETGSKIEIPVDMMNGLGKSVKDDQKDENSETAMYGELMLASLKYKVFIDKNVCSEIKDAYLEVKGGTRISVDYYSVGGSYCVEATWDKFTKNDVSKLVILK